MHITEITAHAASSFNHPFERFANFKPGVTLRAVLKEGENAWEEGRKLQKLAESLVQAEKEATLKRCERERMESLVDSIIESGDLLETAEEVTDGEL